MQTPNASLFPEIDFAAKLPSDENGNNSGSSTFPPLATSFSALSNAGSAGIRKRLAFTRFHVRLSNTGREFEGIRSVEIKLKEDDLS